MRYRCAYSGRDVLDITVWSENETWVYGDDRVDMTLAFRSDGLSINPDPTLNFCRHLIQKFEVFGRSHEG